MRRMTRFDPAYTRDFYDRYGSRESERWDESPRMRMEAAILRHHLRQRVRPGDRVLDAGCGPGTFSAYLMDLGARVTCLDLSPVQLDYCRERSPGAEGYHLGSITELSVFADDNFDVALALGGPLSYCFDEAGAALGELMRVTRPGGWIGLSVMCLFGTIHRRLAGVLTVDPETNRGIVATGDLPRDVATGHECHLFRPQELQELLDAAGLTSRELHATGWLVHDESPLDLPEPGSDAWEWLLEAELAASEASPGAGTHILAWGRAPELT